MYIYQRPADRPANGRPLGRPLGRPKGWPLGQPLGWPKGQPILLLKHGTRYFTLQADQGNKAEMERFAQDLWKDFQAEHEKAQNEA